MIDNPIGSLFFEGEVILTPKEIWNTECSKCWYNNPNNYTKACFQHGHACTPINRNDKKQVIFIQVK